MQYIFLKEIKAPKDKQLVWFYNYYNDYVIM